MIPDAIGYTDYVLRSALEKNGLLDKFYEEWSGNDPLGIIERLGEVVEDSKEKGHNDGYDSGYESGGEAATEAAQVDIDQARNDGKDEGRKLALQEIDEAVKAAKIEVLAEQDGMLQQFITDREESGNVIGIGSTTYVSSKMLEEFDTWRKTQV